MSWSTTIPSSILLHACDHYSHLLGLHVVFVDSTYFSSVLFLDVSRVLRIVTKYLHHRKNEMVSSYLKSTADLCCFLLDIGG